MYSDIKKQFTDLEAQLMDPVITSDPQKMASIGKKHANLKDLIAKILELEKNEKIVIQTKDLLEQESDPEMREMAQAELEDLLPVLVSDGVQVYETSWWLVDQLLPSLRGSAPNTMAAKMRSVAHWLQWADDHKFNWAAEVQSGKFMSSQTIRQVLKWMELEVDLSGSDRVKRLKVAPRTAASRAGSDLCREGSPRHKVLSGYLPGVHFLKGRLPAVSSTGIRKGRRAALDPAVKRYIINHGLYGGKSN